MAAILQDTLAVEAVALESGHRGEFSVWVGDACVAQKTADGFPSEDAVVAAVTDRLR